MEMKLLEIHRGHIKVEALGRTATIGGEGFIRPDSQAPADPNYVDYVVYPNTLTHWDEPWAHEPLPAAVQTAILEFLRKNFAQRGQLLGIE